MLAAARSGKIGSSVTAEVLQNLGAAGLDAARRVAATGRQEEACWRALAVARVGLEVDARNARVADTALVAPALALVNQWAPHLDAEPLKGLLRACESMDEGLQGYSLAVNDLAAVQRKSVLEAFQGASSPYLKLEVEKAGGIGRWLELQDAQVAFVTKLAAAPTAAAADVMARLAAEQKKFSATGVLAPEDYAYWAMSATRLRGTALRLALALDAAGRGSVASGLNLLAPAVMASPPTDLLAGGAWEYVADGVGGRLLRSGPVELGGKVARVELGVDAPAAKPQPKSHR
jgi:hypothetical protein